MVTQTADFAKVRSIYGTRGVGFLHIWWRCEVIQPFQRNIGFKSQEMIGIRVPFNVRFFLLHEFWKWKQGKRYSVMITHLLGTASLLVDGDWKRSSAPSLVKWEAIYIERSRIYICIDMHRIALLSFILEHGSEVRCITSNNLQHHISVCILTQHTSAPRRFILICFIFIIPKMI